MLNQSFQRSYATYANPHPYYPPQQQPYQQNFNAPVWSNAMPTMPQQNYMPPPHMVPQYNQQFDDGYVHENFNMQHVHANYPPQNFNTLFVRQKKEDPVHVEKQKKNTVKTPTILEQIHTQWANTWYKTWIKEELNFSMNKISMTGLLFGLMFLGSVFFLIGFLVAVNLYGGKQTPGMQMENRSLVPSQGAQLSGRTGHAMNASAQPQYGAQHPISNNQPYIQNGRIPSSFNNQQVAMSSIPTARTPSFQMSSAPSSFAQH